MELIDNLKHKFQNGNLATRLVFINVGIFILVSLAQAMTKFDLVSWIGLSADASELLRKPWTIFTYMFLHVRLFHLLFNMLMLWVIGDFFYRYFGDKAFAKFYLIGGICGGLIFLLLNWIQPQNSILMGASAAIYAVLFAMVAYQPDLRVRLLFFNEPIKLLYVAIGFILLGFVLSAENLGGNISHIGGALFGYFYMKQFEKGKSILSDFKNPFKGFERRSKLRAQKKSSTENPPRNDYDFADWKKDKEDKTNKILEKISRSGYNSLTADEKEFLFKQGKK